MGLRFLVPRYLSLVFTSLIFYRLSERPFVALRCAQSSATAFHGIFPALQISSPFHSTQSTANIYFLSFHLNLFINRDSCPNKPPPQFVYERNLSVFTDCAKLFCNASARRGMIGQVKDDGMYAEWVRIGDAGYEKGLFIHPPPAGN